MDDTVAQRGSIDLDAVAARIKGVRAATGLSQAAFGERVGAKKATVQSWENARTAPTYRHLSAILTEFHVTSGFVIYGGWDEMPAGLWREIRSRMLAATSGDARTE